MSIVRAVTTIFTWRRAYGQEVCIKQQARRIDELERVNAELRGQIATT